MSSRKNFVQLTNREHEEILLWRNHISVRMQFVHRHEVTTDEHLKFVASLINDQTRMYYRLGNIGVFALTNVDFQSRTAELSIYGNPYNPQKGKGTLLMQEIISLAFRELGLSELCLRVFSTNSRAINLYKKSGFICRQCNEGIDSIENEAGELVKMTLRNCVE